MVTFFKPYTFWSAIMKPGVINTWYCMGRCWNQRFWTL